MQPLEWIKAENTLGECILWDDANNALWWTDIDGCALHRLDWASSNLRVIKTPRRLASFGFIEGRNDLVAAFDDGFALFDPASGMRGPVLVPEGLKPGMRMNDGRVDRQGRFWAGSMMTDPNSAPEAKLYSIDEGAVRSHLDGLAISNSIAFSPESDFFYFSDSRRGLLWRYDFDPVSGTLGARRELARVAVEPDGACVDQDGCLWSAQWGGGCVVRYTPEGRVDYVLEVPVSQPSCVTFGGSDLDLLFVTSAKLGLKTPAPGAGDVLV
jgi:sugar lactone lactonase YvrE